LNLSLPRAGRFALLLAFCALSGCASHPPAVGDGQPLPTIQPTAFVQQRPDYRIGASDLLAVKVFGIEGLQREVRVNNSGEISLPLVGRLQVGGKTVEDVQAQVEDAYRARYLQDPQVSVLVTERARERVTVEGAVASPGIYPIATDLSLLQAIAVAKGLTNVADQKDIFIYRTVSGQRHIARFDLDEIREGRAPDPPLMAEDVVVVLESDAKVFLRRFVEITPLIGVWTLF
jgi:polysaccharide export outer membrane protein